ncbi:hypothetical protein [Microbacterium sp. cf332]|uniref:hypothetical protein n=1 Tax=Microbacterium sp. cf332 TaxID=1761804 RepID=UPI00088C4002|nr:hypothetical protein [Microbacterium sp. cf332]SDQ81023.1 hypothetical protein SAMN04487847_2581 [Microbacterium sp. cf332]
MLDDFFGSLVGGEIGYFIGRAIKAPFIRAKPGRGKMQAALRLESGSQEGVTETWRRGNIHVRPGLLEFRGNEIRVLRVYEAPREPTARERVRVHTDSIIYSIATPSARLLWAIPGPQSSRALSRLAPPTGCGPEAADKS